MGSQKQSNAQVTLKSAHFTINVLMIKVPFMGKFLHINDEKS